MNHHISAALAHERIAEAVRRAETEMIGSLGTRRPHGSIEVPPFAASIPRKRVRTRDSDLLGIERLRSHPAVAGWLITTARNECLRVLSARKRELPVEEPVGGREADEAPVDDRILAAERREALHLALETVPEHERRLMRLLLQEPQLSYDEISAALGVPKGSIGPTRGRCLARLRANRHLVSVVHGNDLVR